MPGPQVTKALPTHAKLTLEIRRDRFNELAAKGNLADWRAAFDMATRASPGSSST